jgi:hypothetical protein
MEKNRTISFSHHSHPPFVHFERFKLLLLSEKFKPSDCVLEFFIECPFPMSDYIEMRSYQDIVAERDIISYYVFSDIV